MDPIQAAAEEFREQMSVATGRLRTGTLFADYLDSWEIHAQAVVGAYLRVRSGAPGHSHAPDLCVTPWCMEREAAAADLLAELEGA